MSAILATLRNGLTTHSADASRRAATALAQVLPTEITLALHGDLGVGKTTFVQGLARGFDIDEAVTSPTFNLYSVHRGPARTLVHLDAYRLENDRQIEALLLDDFLVAPWCLAVEWPEKIASWLPPDTWHLDLGISGETHTIRLR